jgi:hypothetical protein
VTLGFAGTAQKKILEDKLPFTAIKRTANLVIKGDDIDNIIADILSLKESD